MPMMKLSDFIRTEMEQILERWETFAESIDGAENFSALNLRDHAEEMLLATADDLDTAQTGGEQAAKSKGRGKESKNQAARQHGVDRQESGFSLPEVMSEFRALRASVKALWSEKNDTISAELFEDFTRFDEALDQSLAESAHEYSQLKEKDSRLLDAILTASPDPIFVLDAEGKICFGNQATAELFGLETESITGRSIFDLGCEFISNFKHELETVIANRVNRRGQFTFASESGQENRFDYRLAPVVEGSDNIEATICISRDITLQALAEEKIWHSAHHDDLTGLPNRRLFMERLEQEIKHAKRQLPLAVFFLDLDGFKEVNDAFGHEAGDRLLCVVAERITGCVREEDTVARMGGDEFTVTLTGVEKRGDIEIVAHSILDALAMPFEIEQRSLYVSASIGVAFSGESTTPDELVKAADKAMYEAKRLGPSASSVSYAA